MTKKQQNIICFIERNTDHRIGTASPSAFIGRFWKEAQKLFERKNSSDYVESDEMIFNFAADNGMNEYEARSVLGMDDYPMGGIHCSDDM